jgi:hypothetical protein
MGGSLAHRTRAKRRIELAPGKLRRAESACSVSDRLYLAVSSRIGRREHRADAFAKHLAVSDDDCAKSLIAALDRHPPQLERACHESLALSRRRCRPCR